MELPCIYCKDLTFQTKPVRFLQESYRSRTYQTLSARILHVFYISDKTCKIFAHIPCKNLINVEHRLYLQVSKFQTKSVRFWQSRHFSQIQTFLARFLQVLAFFALPFKILDVKSDSSTRDSIATEYTLSIFPIPSTFIFLLTKRVPNWFSRVGTRRVIKLMSHRNWIIIHFPRTNENRVLFISN